VETYTWRGNSTLKVRWISCVIFIYNPCFAWGINWIYIVRRPGDVPCYECNSCACSRFLGGWRVATIHSKCFRRVHSLTKNCSTCLMSSVLCTNIAVCRSYQKQNINPPPHSQQSPAQHLTRQPTHGDHLVICSLCLAPVLLVWRSFTDWIGVHKAFLYRFMLSWKITTSDIFLPIALEVFLEVGVQRIALRSSARVKKRWYCRELGLTFMRLLPVIMYWRHAEAKTHQFKFPVRQISLLLRKTE
jgi:hypothetical protein